MKPFAMLGIALGAAVMAHAAVAQESKVQLKEGPGKDQTMQCIACHSLDYIQMNSKFLVKAGWTAEVNKMLKVYGAPISEADAPAIIEYLDRNYGADAAK
jgi:hypothetical protein